ncbi:RNA polymerase sigma factor [Thermopirellula anaerolimosa]
MNPEPHPQDESPLFAEMDFQELVRRAAGGCDAALAHLLQRCEPKFEIVARVSLGPLLRSQVDTLDLVQSMKRMLIPGLRAGRFQLDSPEQLVALAATVIRRKVALYWRRQRRKNVPSLPEASLSQVAGGERDPAVMELENEDYLSRLFDKLTHEERRLFQLQLEGMTIAEIARLLGCPAGPLRAKLCRLRKKLRDAADIRA